MGSRGESSADMEGWVAVDSVCTFTMDEDEEGLFAPSRHSPCSLDSDTEEEDEITSHPSSPELDASMEIQDIFHDAPALSPDFAEQIFLQRGKCQRPCSPHLCSLPPGAVSISPRSPGSFATGTPPTRTHNALVMDTYFQQPIDCSSSNFSMGAFGVSPPAGGRRIC